MITHPQTLPFWAGLIDAAVLDGEDRPADFKVHPSKLLDATRTESTLQALEDFALDTRLQFKDFKYEPSQKRVLGYTFLANVRKSDPDYREGVDQHYAYREGRATVESGSRPFLHIFINIRMSPSLRSKNPVGMTITEMKVDMFGIASTICHKFSHALEHHYRGRGNKPQMNDEFLIETGFSLENFLFGGLYAAHIKGERKPCLERWPSPALYNYYKSKNHAIGVQQFADLGSDRCFPVEPRKIAVFLEQSFWDDPQPPVGYWKKMWLRPHVDLALDEDDYNYYNSGSQLSSSSFPLRKRRRLSDATLERKCVADENKRRKEYIEYQVRWHSRKEVSEERKASFQELEMANLNGFGQRCMNGIIPTW